MKNDLKGKKTAVLGLGLEGRDAVSYLLSKGALVTIFDKKPLQELDLTGIQAEKVTFITGENYLSSGFTDFDIIVRSPGFYRYHPEIMKAENKGKLITSPINIFFELNPAKTIGVTGTKGKGTTSTLISEILKKSGRKVFLAGNIGTPVLSLLPQLTKDDWVVLELSSFQLIDIRKSPAIAVVLNITEDHLDWHKDREEYISAKKNIVKYQTENDLSVINADYDTPMSFAEVSRAKAYFFSKKHPVEGSYVEDGVIYLNINNVKQILGRTQNLLLRGEHNWENITAAACAGALAGVDCETITQTIFNFKGLEHRLELVRNVNGVSFYNDSFSTNPQTTIAAVKAFSEPLVLILGGSSKGLQYDEMAYEIVKNKNVKAAILIGEIAPLIQVALEKMNYQGSIYNLGKPSMTELVGITKAITKNGDVVLLSPATASFDMFANYKDRGNRFKKAVNEL